MISTNKKMNLKKFKKIFLMAPAKVYTGGPELTHQLGYFLKNDLNKDVKIYYIPNKEPEPVHNNLKKYSLKYVNEIEDNSENLLVIPEYFDFINNSIEFKNIKKVIWWQSLDNYFGSRFKTKNSKILRSILKIPFNFINIFNKISNYSFGILTLESYLKFLYKFNNPNKHLEIKDAYLHLVQSTYAFNFLNTKFENIYFLSDFIRDDLLDKKNIQKNQKENIICFNPKKSNDFMNLIIKKSNHNFIPLINLSNDEIINVLLKSKVYIDIGSHPGKDRLPREAALLGNCVITNKKGSASIFNDVSIPSEFKFKESYFNIIKINKKINYIFNNYDQEYNKFKTYVDKITEEKKVFLQEIDKIFK